MNRLKLVLILTVLAGCGSEQGSQAPSDEDIALNNRGVALMGYFDYSGAVDVFEQVVTRQPEWLDARTNLAIALKNRQQPGDELLALQQLETVLTDDADNARANYVAGLLRLYLGEIETASGHFQSVLEADPSDAYAHYYLGQCLLRLGDPEAALTSYRHTVELDPYVRSAYYGAAQVLQQLGRADDASAQLALFERMATNPRARLAEFKYTRMGPKSLALAAGDDEERVQSPVPPQGPLFAAVSSASAGATLPGRPHLTTADVDADGDQELLLAGEYGALLLESDLSAGARRPWSGTTDIRAAAWGDIDNNGLVDLFLCRAGADMLWMQTGADEWQQADIASRGDCSDALMVDADHDGDLDILIGNYGHADNLLNNNRDGSFRSLRDQLGNAATQRRTRRVISADIDADRDVDLIFLDESNPHTVLVNDRLWNYRVADGLDSFVQSDLRAATVADLDADGQAEIIGVRGDGQVVVWRRVDANDWQFSPIHTAEIANNSDVDIAPLDIDGDGVLELVLLGDGAFEVIAIDTGMRGSAVASETFDGGTPIPVLRSPSNGHSLVALGNEGELLEWAPGPGRYSFVTLQLSGKHDDAESMRSNASGIGTLVALRNGRHWTLTDTYQHTSMRGHSLQPVAIGLRGRARADFVALSWSDGVFQTELDLQSGAALRISETERQLSSCPVLFAWDGERYAFVTDLLGVGGLGGFVEPGVVGTPRPWERLSLPPGTTVARDGLLQFKLTEPMQENAYVDAVTMESYDLPPGWQIVVDERMATGAPEVTGDVLFYRESASPIAAHDSAGVSVLADILQRDNHAMNPGTIDRRFIGLLESVETVTLEFDAPLERSGATPVLVADAWVEYPYSQTVFSAWQANLQYRSVTLEARDSNGDWHEVYPEFGYPAGMPREMSLPMHDLPEGTDALRLSWNRELYWDRFRVVFAESPPGTMRHDVARPSLARVAKSGFAKRITHEQRRPEYDYQQRVPFWDTEYASGYYTDLGEMTELLTETDDAIAVIGAGEEIHLEFAASPVPEGLERWYVLETRGWAKDMDLYTHQGTTVGPLPRALADSDNADRERLHQQYNNRFQAGR
jgi:tetratricopeptide (TPR) repeat protein